MELNLNSVMKIFCKRDGVHIKLILTKKNINLEKELLLMFTRSKTKRLKFFMQQKSLKFRKII
jgi:hypothetical protein